MHTAYFALFIYEYVPIYSLLFIHGSLHALVAVCCAVYIWWNKSQINAVNASAYIYLSVYNVVFEDFFYSNSGVLLFT